MSELNAGIVNNAIHRVLRVAGALSYGSLVLPYEEGVERSPVRARRVPALKQWIIERENFEVEVIRGYSQMEDGAARQLVAGTGVGKSTVLPYAITSQMGVSGIVLTPNNALPVASMPFLMGKFREWGGSVKPVILRSKHASEPEQSPALYYSSAVDFLARMAKRPSLLHDLGVDFVYLDESHEVRPEYVFFRYAKEAGILGNVKVFYGTATAAGDLNMESGGIGRTVVGKPPNLFPMASPKAVPVQSPLYYGNIQDRTLVFVSTDMEASTWAEYYDEHDVPVMAYMTCEGDRALSDVPGFLDAHGLCVLLVPSFFQTGFTFNVDTVIDTGFLTECKMDFSVPRMELKRRPVTSAERTQRMGRVGRYKPGRGFYADVAVTPPISEDIPEVAMYVFLWARVFNVTINEPAVRDFEQLTGEITPKAAAILIHSRIHPYLLVPYVANDGFYEHWGKVLKYVLYSSMLIEGEQSNIDKVQNWKQMSTGPVDYSASPVKYRCAVQFPKEWAILPAVAWLVYNRAVDAQELVGLSGRSVISAVNSEVGQRRHTQRTTRVMSAAISGIDPGEVSPPRRNQTSRAERVDAPRAGRSRRTLSEDSIPTIRQLQNAYSVQDRISRLPPLEQVISPEPPDAPVERVQAWQRDVPVSANNARRLSHSTSSDDKDEIVLRQVNPEKFLYHKLYPMDPKIFDEYVADESVTREDHKRVSLLLTGRRDFSALPDDATTTYDRQLVYFIAILRVHNSALSRKLQITANMRPSFISRTIMSFSRDVEDEEAKIRSTVRLLRACALQSYFVGVDSRTLHASVTSSVLTPVYTEYEARAKIMLAFGDVVVNQRIASIKPTAMPILDGDRCVANAWNIGPFIVTVSHAVDEDDRTSWPEKATQVYCTDWEHDITIFETNVVGYRPYIRFAKDTEYVYILYYDTQSGKVSTIGDFEINGHGDPIILDFLLTRGCSAALVIAVEDGAVLGMYRGQFDSQCAWIIPMTYVKDQLYD